MISENIISLMHGFSVTALWITIKPLLLFIFGIVIYAVFIFKFYRFVAKKDLFEVNLEQYKPGWKGIFEKIINGIEYVFKYFMLFPIFLFTWFLVLTILLVFLTKSQTVQEVMLISVALIGAIRVTAYYNEDLSRDLAKMMPFALLGVFLIDVSVFNQADSFELLSALPEAWRTALYYLFFISGLELILRIGTAIIHLFRKKKDEKIIEPLP